MSRESLAVIAGIKLDLTNPTYSCTPSGYMTPTFTGKDQQRQQVIAHVASKGFMPKDLVTIEVGWFYNNLAIDDSYFQSETVEAISDHVLALYGAKLQAFTRNDPESIIIELEKITDSSMVFIHTSPPGQTSVTGPGATCERRIDDRIDNSTPQEAFRLETYRSAGSISATASQQLRCYFVSKCQWLDSTPSKVNGKTDIRSVSDKTFLERATPNTIQIYQRVMTEVESRTGPVIEYFEVEGTNERRVVIGYKMGGTRHIFSALSDLYHFYGLYSARKYVEQFSNGITIISLYLNPHPKFASTKPPINHSIVQIAVRASLLWVFPDNPFFGRGLSTQDPTITTSPPTSEGHAVQEATYAYAGWIFAQHFCNRLGPAYLALKNVLNESNPEHADVLHAVKTRFRDETFTRQSIFDIVAAYPELLRLLYVHFATIHYPSEEPSRGLQPTLSYIRLKNELPLSDEELYDKIRKTVSNKHELQVFEAFLAFNKNILRTNFYTPTKVALSFRLKPDFLSEAEYAKRPFGIFLVVGSDFRGFHIRMRDVARGGIRIVRSRGRENYSINQRSLFDENYALAATQVRLTLGGIPHDVYGMTSLSVRQYVTGIYKSLGLVEKDVTKVQTGGPDGDLGSNEIFLSSDKTITIIDGSGVAHDPRGLDRTELVRLAKARQMVSNFDKSKLSPQGYVVLIDETDRVLPSKLQIVPDGTTFRNSAHLRYKADILVPCGGRPEAINISNVSSLVDSEGKPHYKYIVEGANLFITQSARLYLESRGVVLYKDSSANKGGVSCSSLEVLAGLALTDDEHTKLMTFPGSTPTPFYKEYVQGVQARIADNAALEFSCIWKEHQRLAGTKGATPRTLLSDKLSESINSLTTDLETSDLFEDQNIRQAVLSKAVPSTLLAVVPLDVLAKRLPEPYQRALFSSFMASQYVYRYGINAKMVQFYQFARDLSSHSTPSEPKLTN
ncbi:NAD-dependent glutamate dehydrogenase [Clavulina sp. PMI_390]|nr:NAD-dependent glutamate dehydrogenase [Clavulina sp. PMI_390]